ncbi:MAG: hypothetical protein AABZ53_01290 [Planctomycetota bacterium]
MRLLCLVIASLAPALLAPSALAQTLTARSSQLNFNYVYGAGGDTHVGGDLRQFTNLTAFDSDSMTFTGSTSGVLPGDQPYSAGVDGTIEYGYLITGPLHEIRTIRAQASTQVSAATSGLGSALFHASNPGNEIVLSFTVQTAIPYQLSGSITLPNASAFSYVALQRFNGFAWDYQFYSAFLPGGQGPFDVTGTLIPGDYRLRSILSINAGANEFVQGAYDYRLDVPGLGSCPADFDSDGAVDFFDYDAFVICFEGGPCPPDKTADFDGDGTVDFFDYDIFVVAFELGC